MFFCFFKCLEILEWIPDIVNFMLLGAVFKKKCLLSILGLCSGVQLPETVSSFWVLLYDLLSGSGEYLVLCPTTEARPS